MPLTSWWIQGCPSTTVPTTEDNDISANKFVTRRRVDGDSMLLIQHSCGLYASKAQHYTRFCIRLTKHDGDTIDRGLHMNSAGLSSAHHQASERITMQDWLHRSRRVDAELSVVCSSSLTASTMSALCLATTLTSCSATAYMIAPLTASSSSRSTTQGSKAESRSFGVLQVQVTQIWPCRCANNMRPDRPSTLSRHSDGCLQIPN